MAGGFSMTGIGLTAVFIFFLLALAVQLFCVFWCRRRRFRGQTSSATPSSMSDIINLHHPPSAPSPAPSKELLYFICCKTQPSPVEPVPSPAPRYPDIPRKLNGTAASADSSTWWMGMYDPSTLLQTDTTKAAEKKEKEEECSSSSTATDDLERGVAVREATTTTFFTPCASPPFYTPLSSPLAERKGGAGNPTTILSAKTASSAA